MSRNKSILSTAAERRATDAVPPVREAALRPAPALTRREERVRRILLKELERMNEWKRLTYSEKNHLQKQLDVDWIDRELARMTKQVRRSIIVRNVSIPIVAVMVMIGVLVLVRGEFSWHHLNLVVSPLYVAGPVFATRALRRKMFIYEALRELSDADEIDVAMDRSIRQADDLIRRIVERELEMEEAYPLRSMLTN